MNLLYITADKVGMASGGGLVTRHEADALKELGPCGIWDRQNLESVPLTIRSDTPEPWVWDVRMANVLTGSLFVEYPKLVHFYSGTFSETVKILKQNGCKVTFTIAAHDRFVSRQEHEKLGMGFPYPHLVVESEWLKYIEGYHLADVIICPSTVAEKTVRAYGKEFENKDIRVIPHGCTLPEKVAPLPKRFVVGYLGAIAADKGIVYLLQAWKKLNYKDAYLVLAGKDSDGDGAKYLIQHFGGGNILCRGWVNDVSDFYNSISLYIQPSCTEGFGIEVLEALSYSRPVLCSRGAGAVDLVRDSWRFDPGNVEQMCSLIERARATTGELKDWKEVTRARAERYTWDKIRKQYQQVWQEMLR